MTAEPQDPDSTDPDDPGELFRALAQLLSPPEPALKPLARALEIGALPPRAEHTEVFTLELVPYASIYLGNSGHIGGRARERVAGFWRALELTPPAEPDHLAALLSLFGALAGNGGREAGAVGRHRRRALLGEHLLPWLPLYLLKLRGMPSEGYRRWGGLLEAALERETERHAPPDSECLHWRECAPLPPAAALDFDELVAILLAPGRSGVIVTRRDLRLAARDLGVAGRIGERRFMLTAMLRQRPGEVLDWIVRYLEAAAKAYASEREWSRATLDRASRNALELRDAIRTVRS